MRLEVTRRADLATRAMIALAVTGERRKASELAEDLDTSPGFLSQAMTPSLDWFGIGVLAVWGAVGALGALRWFKFS